MSPKWSGPRDMGMVCLKRASQKWTGKRGREAEEKLLVATWWRGFFSLSFRRGIYDWGLDGHAGSLFLTNLYLQIVGQRQA